MNLLPPGQKQRQILNEGAPDCGNLAEREAVVFAEGHNSRRHIQFKNGLPPLANNVHMRGPMIVREDNNPQCANPQVRLAWDKHSINPCAWVNTFAKHLWFPDPKIETWAAP
jgi:hypothetical protein